MQTWERCLGDENVQLAHGLVFCFPRWLLCPPCGDASNGWQEPLTAHLATTFDRIFNQRMNSTPSVSDPRAGSRTEPRTRPWNRRLIFPPAKRQTSSAMKPRRASAPFACQQNSGRRLHRDRYRLPSRTTPGRRTTTNCWSSPTPARSGDKTRAAITGCSIFRRPLFAN